MHLSATVRTLKYVLLAFVAFFFAAQFFANGDALVALGPAACGAGLGAGAVWGRGQA
jgi:hypothetical protein